MPKVVSFRNNIFTNAKKNLNDEKFNVIYCKKCTTHCVITDAVINSLPKRRTDNAIVLDHTKWTIRLNTSPESTPTKMNRPKGIETQYHHNCIECGSYLAYQSTHPDENPQFLYLIQENIILPNLKKKNQPQCTICGFICRDEDHFEQHKRQRGHYNQSEGTLKNSNDADPDAPIPPLIVG